MKIRGVGPETPMIKNEAGGKQSSSPYRLDLIPPLAIFRESEVLKKGAEKYGENNWKKIPIQDHLNHILQHVYAYLAGDRSDDHLANIACRAHFALELQEEYMQKMAGDLQNIGLANAQLKPAFAYPNDFEESTHGEARTVVCIDCKGPLGPMYFGAGDGTGQKFRCEPCNASWQLTVRKLDEAHKAIDEAIEKL